MITEHERDLASVLRKTLAEKRELESRLSALQQSHARMKSALEKIEILAEGSEILDAVPAVTARTLLPIVRAAIAEATPTEKKNV